MAQVIPQGNRDPADNILTSRAIISNSLQTIRRHVDGGRVLNQANLGMNFDSITRRLNEILQNAQQLQGLTQRHINLQQNFNNIRGERDNLTNQVARQQVMINNEHDLAVRNHQEAVNLFNALNRCIADLRHRENALRQCREDRGLLEYNRDRLYDRYRKWKQKTIDERVLNHNLNLQNILLQNNPPPPPIIQNPGMAGYAPKSFYGHPGEDPLVWLQEFRQWCDAGGIDPQANARNRVRIHGVFETCMKDDAKDWYENNIRGKNWECQNILDNTNVANLNAFNALDNGALTAINANQFRGNALIRRGVANATGADIIPSHTVWGEDWSIAGGRPSDMAPNAPNAGGGGTVVVSSMRIGQVIYEFITNFPTITAEKSKVAFNGITQGLDTVNRFYSNLRRMVKLAYPTLPEINQNEMVRQQFLNNISHENKLEARRIGLENPTNVILRKLEEIERYRKDNVTQPSLLPFQSQPTSVHQGPSLSDMERLIDSKLQRPSNISFDAPAKKDYMGKVGDDPGSYKLLLLAYRLGFSQPDGDERDVRLNDIEKFIDEHLHNYLPKDDVYNALHIKRFGSAPSPRTSRKTHTASNLRKCSKCGKTGHTKSSCSKGKKKKSNYAEHDSSSSSNSSDDTSSTSDSDDHYCFGIKSKEGKKKSLIVRNPKRIDIE